MAFFKFRKKSDDYSAAPAQPESVDVMRRRAKHRLMGAAVLVLLGVIGFPMLFDKQPRPISVDMPIEIPDRNKVKPLSIPAPAAAQADAPEIAAPVRPPAPPSPVAAVVPKIEENVPQAHAAAAQEAIEIIATPEPKPVDKPVEKPAEKPKLPAVKADDGNRAQALLEGQKPEKKLDASEGRYVVQVGAFADAVRVREVRQKVEHVGLKTYTQEVETKDGRRIRVRVGPFASKADADKALEKIKKLNLSAAILTL